MRTLHLGGAVLAATLVAATLALAAVHAAPQRETSGPTWEYLVVAGGHTNLEPTGSSSLRKAGSSGFEREAFPLESNMDKLGRAGWELVSVGGAPGEPVYYFKRPK
jgi:hypothetical protein